MQFPASWKSLLHFNFPVPYEIGDAKKDEIRLLTKNLIFDLKNIFTGGQTGTNGFSGNNGQLTNSSTSTGNGGGGGQSGGSGRAAIYSINGGI